MDRILTADTTDKIEQEVTVYGWVHVVRKMGKIIFIELRDRSGLLQIVFGPDQVEAYATAQQLKPEYVVRVTGTIAPRVGKQVRDDHPTGTVELQAHACTILAKSDTPPFEIEDEFKKEVNEELRFQYRYLDLRRPKVRNTILLRSAMKNHIRGLLQKEGFTEIDTPLLTKSTPEGARDFLVPSRLHPGEFYALPQSPQQYKQLLMVAGFERYFQFPKCFRDEDQRADRMLEFEQLDMELSFVSREDIFKLVEALVISVTENVLKKTIQKKPFPRLSYSAVMEQYGVDNPDLRQDKDNPDMMAYAFITDFPAFEKKDDGSYGAVHHPFTMLHPDDVPLLDDKNKLLDIRAQQYDLVLNGAEIFGGSIRITDPEIQEKVFQALGHQADDIKEKFGHLLTAFKYGVPPHGGIASGFDRWLMVALGQENIRETVAFPTTTSSGISAVMNAPSTVTENQLLELGLQLRKSQ